MIEEEERLEDSFVAMVDQLEAGNLPAATSVDYQTADRALNMAYGEVMKADAAEIGTVKKADIRTAERAWIRYRDEWVRFARSRSPAVMPEAIKTWLTQQRTKQLRGEDR